MYMYPVIIKSIYDTVLVIFVVVFVFRQLYLTFTKEYCTVKTINGNTIGLSIR